MRERVVRPLASALRLLISVVPLLTSTHLGPLLRFSNFPLAPVPRWHSHDDYDRKGAEWLHFVLDTRKQKPGSSGFSGWGALDFELLAKASSSMPNASYARMDQSWDITEWLAPHIAKGIKHHTKVLRWHYTLDKDGHCIAKCRASAQEGTGEDWYVLGRVLTSKPSIEGPQAAKLWHNKDSMVSNFPPRLVGREWALVVVGLVSSGGTRQ